MLLNDLFWFWLHIFIFITLDFGFFRDRFCRSDCFPLNLVFVNSNHVSSGTAPFIFIIHLLFVLLATRKIRKTGGTITARWFLSFLFDIALFLNNRSSFRFFLNRYCFSVFRWNFACSRFHVHFFFLSYCANSRRTSEKGLVNFNCNIRVINNFSVFLYWHLRNVN